MLRYILPMLGFCMLSVYGVQEYTKYAAERPAVEPEPVQQHVEPTQQKQAVSHQPETPLYGRKTRIEMDNTGHFITTARMNGRDVEVLVDTGATSVAINNKTARRLRINLKPSDFKYEVNTANGKTRAAYAIIDRIQIGKVSVRNVQAVVLDDKALDGTLLGMSFLGQLKSFEVKNRQLVLAQ